MPWETYNFKTFCTPNSWMAINLAGFFRAGKMATEPHATRHPDFLARKHVQNAALPLSLFWLWCFFFFFSFIPIFSFLPFLLCCWAFLTLRVHHGIWAPRIHIFGAPSKGLAHPWSFQLLFCWPQAAKRWRQYMGTHMACGNYWVYKASAVWYFLDSMGWGKCISKLSMFGSGQTASMLRDDDCSWYEKWVVPKR